MFLPLPLQFKFPELRGYGCFVYSIWIKITSAAWVNKVEGLEDQELENPQLVWREHGSYHDSGRRLLEEEGSIGFILPSVLPILPSWASHLPSLQLISWDLIGISLNSLYWQKFRTAPGNSFFPLGSSFYFLHNSRVHEEYE